MKRKFPMIAIAAAALLAVPPFVVPSIHGASAKEHGAEKGKGKGGGPAKQFERYDRNNDGVVDADEVKQRLSRFMKRADKNEDGVVDAEEIKALKEKAAAKSEKAGNNFDKKIRKLDTDGDGKITETEALTRPGWFDRADKDKDGKVTKAEIDELAEKRGKRAEAKAEKKENAAADQDGEDDGDDED